MITADIAIVGAGMAGASLAAALGGAVRCVLVEAEEQPGYHATGRSAAFWSETYGGPAVQPLTSASGDYLGEHGFLLPRGELSVAESGHEALLDAFVAQFAGSGVVLERHGRAALEARIPGLRTDWQSGVGEPSCRDIDVAGLHAHYLAGARRCGVEMLCGARVHSIDRRNGRWVLGTSAGQIDAAVLVNAAGAWASDVAAMASAAPIAITPYRRTVVQLQVEPGAPANVPLVMDIAGRCYFKPEAGGRIWVSPHDETVSPPCDAAPEEIDVAVAIDRFEKMVEWRVVRRERAWAGLRSFAPDRVPVYGFDHQTPGFFWFAGQGGFGIQTAPAAAAIAAALLLGRPMPAPVAGIDVGRYDPGRF